MNFDTVEFMTLYLVLYKYLENKDCIFKDNNKKAIELKHKMFPKMFELNKTLIKIVK